MPPAGTSSSTAIEPCRCTCTSATDRPSAVVSESAGGSISRSSTRTAPVSSDRSTCGAAAARTVIPLDLESVWVAVLRLSAWIGDAPLLVSWADLIDGARLERIVDLGAELDRSSSSSTNASRRCAHVRRHDARRRAPVAGGAVASPGARPMRARCRSGPREAIRDPGSSGSRRRPSTCGQRCRRSWWLQHVLGVPASDEMGSPDHGQLVHDVLRFDPRRRHLPRRRARRRGARPPRGSSAVARRDRCATRSGARRPPSTAAHELELARFHRAAPPMFMATAGSTRSGSTTVCSRSATTRPAPS